MMATLRLKQMSVTAHRNEDHDVAHHQPLKWAENQARDVRAASYSNCNTSIYQIGWSSSACRTGSVDDPLRRSTMLRWGNYDVVQAAVQSNASEIPTAAVPFVNGNPVPAAHSLPSSFSPATKPIRWGPMPWPAIGPEVTGRRGLVGLLSRFPLGPATTTPRKVAAEYQFLTPALAIIHDHGPPHLQILRSLSIDLPSAGKLHFGWTRLQGLVTSDRQQ
jgi:hypothetical protein